jgi:serine/threonine protein kinase
VTLPAERIVAGVVLSERVSAGAYGLLFRAQYQGQRDVRALLIDTKLLDEDSFRATLSDERAMAKLTELTHPAVVPILAVESEGADVIVVTRGVGSYITVFDLISQIRARSEKLPLDVAMAIATAVFEGLAKAHEHGIVHGGIHPRSVLIDQSGGVHITDFAVGRALTTAVAQGADAALWRGLSGFLAPELVLGDEPSPASDVFAAGAMLGCLLSGDIPVTETSLLPDDALGAVCRRSMESDVAKRCPDGGELAALLRAAIVHCKVTVASQDAIARAAGLLSNAKSFDDDTESLLEGLGDVAQKAPMRPSIELRAEQALANRAAAAGPAPAPRKKADTGGLDDLLSDLAGSSHVRGAVPVVTAPAVVATPVVASSSPRDTSGLDALLSDLRGSSAPAVAPAAAVQRAPSGQQLILDGSELDEVTPLPTPIEELEESRGVAAKNPAAASSEAAALDALIGLGGDTLATPVVKAPVAEKRISAPAPVAVPVGPAVRPVVTGAAPIAVVKTVTATKSAAKSSAALVDQTERDPVRDPGTVRRAPPLIEPARFAPEPPNLTRSTWWIWVVLMLAVAGGGVFLYQRQEQKARESRARHEADLRRAEELSKQAAEALPTPGKVRIRSKPGAAGVWLLLGRTPLDSFPMSSAMLHELRIELDGFESADTQVLPGNWTSTGDERKALIALSMRPGSNKLPATPPEPIGATGYGAGRGPIHVETSPTGAQVWLYVGVSDNMELGGIQAGKEYEFLLTKDGFLPGHGKVARDEWQDEAGKKEIVEKVIELVPLPVGSGSAASGQRKP